MSGTRESFRKSLRRSRGALTDGSAHHLQRTVYKTPYATVSSRKVHKVIDESVDDTRRKVGGFKQIETVCKDFVGKTWTCFTCSPLVSFKADRSSLRRSVRLLSSFISSELRKSAEYSSLDSGEISASFSIVKGIAVRKDEEEALKITLRNPRKESTCEIYLCSVDVSKRDYGYKSQQRQLRGGAERNAKNIHVLPLVMCTGQRGQRDATLAWLEKSFNCTISPLEFSAFDLEWMISMWCSLSSSKGDKAPEKDVGFTWNLPYDGLEGIQAQIDAEAARTIWDCLAEGDRNEVTLEMVDQFMMTIHDHFFQSYHINFHALPLTEISCPIVWVNTGGRIKVSLGQGYQYGIWNFWVWSVN